jgi:DNA-binding NtrC family response regulator
MSQNVLLVDDESNVLRALVRVLRKQPYHVFTSRSAEEAIEILKSHPIDLVVTDEKMSGIRGSELSGWIAKHFPEVTRIMLTGMSNVPSIENAVTSGKVFRYLTKPCTENQIATAIHEGLELREKQLLAKNSGVVGAVS